MIQVQVMSATDKLKIHLISLICGITLFKTVKPKQPDSKLTLALRLCAFARQFIQNERRYQSEHLNRQSKQSLSSSISCGEGWGEETNADFTSLCLCETILYKRSDATNQNNLISNQNSHFPSPSLLEKAGGEETQIFLSSVISTK